MLPLLSQSAQSLMLSAYNATQNTVSQEEIESSTNQQWMNPLQDPTGSATTLRNQQMSDQLTQWSQAQTDATSQLNATNQALSEMISTMQQAQQLATTGANATMTAADRSALAQQLTATQSNLVSALNTQWNGQSLFAANPQALTAPVATSTSITNVPAAGTTPYTQTVAIGPSTAVTTNLSGYTGGQSSFQSALTAINQAITALQSNQSPNITAITTATTTLNGLQSQVGGTLAQVQTAQQATATWQTMVTTAKDNASQPNAANLATAITQNQNTLQDTLSVLKTSLSLNVWSYLFGN